MQQEEIDGRRDAAAAIGDHTLVFRNALRLEFGFRLAKRNKGLGPGIEQRRGRHVATTGHAAGPAIAAGLESPVKLRAERVDDNGAPLGGSGERLMLVDEKSTPRFCR